jgi:hypothetical protein
MMARVALALGVLPAMVPCLVAVQQSTKGHRIGTLGPGPANCALPQHCRRANLPRARRSKYCVADCLMCL